MASDQEHVNFEHQHVEKALLKSEELWRRVFENSAIGIALATTQGRFMAGNIAYQRMLG
jgi:PAS domain-containing protein